MGNSRGGRPQGLSQLQRLRQYPSFFLRKGLSGFAVLFFGALGSFPMIPDISLKDGGDAISEPATTVSADPLEVCRWQKDFTFLNDVLGEKSSAKEQVPCAPVAVAVAEVVPPVQEDRELEDLIVNLTSGYPLEQMAPAISLYDREVAALIVGIAKKESNWGKRVPVDEQGKDCFNYWGFKGAGARGVAMGHGCFGTPEEAVQAVGNRIAQLVELRKTSEPKNMIIWKCGSSCATHSPESVRKWIADVDMYYRKIVQN